MSTMRIAHGLKQKTNFLFRPVKLVVYDAIAVKFMGVVVHSRDIYLPDIITFINVTILCKFGFSTHFPSQ